jgi:excisionase family DNA binding protein
MPQGGDQDVSIPKTATGAVAPNGTKTIKYANPDVQQAEQALRKTIIEIIEAKTSAFPLKEFATLTGIAYSTAYDMVKDGRLSAMWVGSSIRLDPKKTAEYLRQRETV